MATGGGSAVASISGLQLRSRFRLVLQSGTFLTPSCFPQQTGKSDERFTRVLAHDGLQVLSPKVPVEKHCEKAEEVQMNMRKSRFLLSTAVLLAGVSLAAAQGMREGSGGGMGAGSGAAEHDKSGGGKSEGGMSQGPGGASRGEGMTQSRAAEPRGGGRAEGPAAGQSRTERSEGMREGGRAAERGQIGKDQQDQKDQTVGQRRGDRHQPRQSEQKAQDKDQSYGKQNSQSIGQGRGERDQTRQSEQKTPQGQKDQSTTTGANTRPSNAPAPGQAAQGQTTQGQTTQQNQGATTGTQATAPAQNQSTTSTTTQSMSGRVSLNAQQQTTLQQSVLSSRNVARVNASSIDFQINTGVVVPRHINVVSVSAFPVLIDVFPAFRDDSFFVVDDEIVVLDHSRRIVDVVPAGPRTRFSRAGSMGGGGVSGGSVAALNLRPEEIRVVQQVLIERGLLIGEADGVLGTRTREALITFQRQQGIQASGSIDTRTVSALGVSNKISATQSQTTTGQGQANQQQPAQQGTTGQNTGQANAPAQQNQPATTGQAQQNQPATTGQAQQNPPATTGQAQQNQPATTGQGGTQQPSGQTTGQAAPPTQGNNPPAANQSMPSGQPNQSNPPASSQPADNQGKKN